MQQSNFIFGALLIAYIVFITVRGELPTYLELLKGNGATAASGSSGSTSSLLSAGGSLLTQAQSFFSSPSNTPVSQLPGATQGGQLFPGGV